jgi:hypothetical protein
MSNTLKDTRLKSNHTIRPISTKPVEQARIAEAAHRAVCKVTASRRRQLHVSHPGRIAHDPRLRKPHQCRSHPNGCQKRRV